MSEIESAGIKGSLSAIQLDVTDKTSVSQAMEHVQVNHGKLDVLVNNAAIGGLDIEDLQTRLKVCLDTNVVGAAVVAAAFQPLLLKAPNPYSIYVSSGAGSMTRAAEPGPNHMAREESYRLSKSALNMLAVLDAYNLGPNGLKVFAWSPGFVVSNLRGTSEEARSGWGGAGDPQVSGKSVLSILQGERDADVGKLIYKDGVYPW